MWITKLRTFLRIIQEYEARLSSFYDKYVLTLWRIGLPHTGQCGIPSEQLVQNLWCWQGRNNIFISLWLQPLHMSILFSLLFSARRSEMKINKWINFQLKFKVHEMHIQRIKKIHISFHRISCEYWEKSYPKYYRLIIARQNCSHAQIFSKLFSKEERSRVCSRLCGKCFWKHYGIKRKC